VSVTASLSVSSSAVNCLHSARMAERIKVLFWVETLGVPRNIVIDGVPIPHGFNLALAKLLLATCHYNKINKNVLVFLLSAFDLSRPFKRS